MTPLNSYVHAVRPFTEACFAITESYARFLQHVGGGEYSLLTSQNMTKHSNGTDKTKAAPTPETGTPPIASTAVSKSFDPFSSWKLLAAFIPTPAATAVQRADRIPSEAEAAQALIDELRLEVEHMRADLRRVEEKGRAIADNPIHEMPVLNPLNAFRMGADMLATIAGAAPTRTGVEREVIEAHAGDPKSQPNSGTTQEAARRRARKTRHTKTQTAEDKSARRKSRRGKR